MASVEFVFFFQMTKKVSKSVTFQDALAALTASKLPSDAELRELSDLYGDKLNTWRDAWNVLATERRVALIERLREFAEEDLESDFRPLFRHGLNDADERVRVTSIEGLYEDEHPSLIDPLIALMRDDPSETVRAAAIESLGRFMQLGELDKVNSVRREQVYSALMRALHTSSQGSLAHRRALEALAFVSNDEVDLHIRDAFASQNDLLRLSAVIAMGNSHNRAYQTLVRNELQSLSPAVRRAAARASGQLEDEDAVPELAQMLEDPDMDVRFVVLDSLAEIGGKIARNLIEAATKSEEEDMAAHAEEALEEYDFWHGNIDFSLTLFDEDEQKPTRLITPKITGPADGGADGE